MLTAVSNPKVKSVPARSLSIVLGTPTTFTPFWNSFCATDSVSSPPMAISASHPCLLQSLDAAFEAVLVLRGIGARSAQNGAAARQNSAHRLEIERHGLVFQQAAPAFHESDKLVLVVKGSLAHHGADHRVQSRTIATAG